MDNRTSVLATSIVLLIAVSVLSIFLFLYEKFSLHAVKLIQEKLKINILVLKISIGMSQSLLLEPGLVVCQPLNASNQLDSRKLTSLKRRLELVDVFIVFLLVSFFHWRVCKQLNVFRKWILAAWRSIYQWC